MTVTVIIVNNNYVVIILYKFLARHTYTHTHTHTHTQREREREREKGANIRNVTRSEARLERFGWEENQTRYVSFVVLKTLHYFLSPRSKSLSYLCLCQRCLCVSFFVFVFSVSSGE